MKTVFKSIPDCIHVYFQFNQTHGRCGNVFFDGSVLYSYGRHFELAKLVDGALFINTRAYSNSTARHQSYVKQSINYSKVSKVVKLDFGRGVFDVPNIANYHYSRANYYKYASHGKGFKDLAKIEYHFKQLEILEAEGLIKMDFSRFEFNVIEALALLKARQAKQSGINKKREATREAKREAERRYLKAIETERLGAWLRGEINHTFTTLDKVYLRIKGETVETTKGARVPLSEALRLLAKIRSGAPVHGERVGAFTVTRVTLDTVVIGCHVINFETINEIFQ